MKYGTDLPLQAATGTPAVRERALALEAAGYDYLGLGGHLLSAAAGRYPDRPAALYSGDFHDPFVVFGYLAAATERIAFRTSILILPLYNTVHVARAAASLANLSGGRFELGVGISWNPDEYRAAGQDFHRRGRRMEEQLLLLRELWSQPYVSFSGHDHQVDDLGLAGSRSEHPIPVWIGTREEERPMRRAAQVADGWMPLVEPSPEVLARLHGYLDEAGRDRAAFGLALRLEAGDAGPGEWVAEARRLQSLGATHLNISAPPALDPAARLQRLVEARRVVFEAVG